VIVFGSWDEGWTPQDTGFDTVWLRMKRLLCCVHLIVVLFQTSAASGNIQDLKNFPFWHTLMQSF